MAVPLRERGQIFGALVVGTAQQGRRWTDAERELMTAYGRHVEVALAVARAQDGLVQAHTDALTGLPNRPALLDRLEQRLAQADRGGAPVTVLFLDLDGFKLINDSLGHDFGDQLLVATSARLRRCVRAEDVCARLGGDEFAVLLAETSDPGVVAERIIESVGKRFSLSGHEMFVTVSIGVATGTGEGETLLGNADMAMYHAKRTSPGTFAHFEPTMRAARLSRLGLDADLRRAVAENQFELNFQPLVALRACEIVGFECLVRWRHPERGIVPPPVFIPAAEETGLIVDIDCWVLEEACRTLAHWSRHRSLVMSANVSVAALGHPRYAAIVEREIGGLITPSSLIVEVTESANLSDTPAALATLRRIKALGARVALDDFGTGYSTLATLSQLPVDIVKVPRPFLIAETAEGGVDPDRMLAGVIGLGRHLGLRTVVEGIETEEQLATVSEYGADLGQGYLLGRPVDGQCAEALLLGDAAAPARPARAPVTI
jgi:diguanylate cyclase (GGDEF)-like protein